MKRKFYIMILSGILATSSFSVTSFAAEETNIAAEEETAVSESEETETSDTSAEEGPVAETTHGSIRGEIDENNNVMIFRGIPYGSAVDGENRFLPAEEAEDWEGIRDCTKNGNIAYQHSQSISGSPDFGPYFSGSTPEIFRCEDEEENENCLFLNVVTPNTDTEKRPVIVYIHGGGYATGSGSLVLGSGKMVNEEDVVMVGVNHRLNVFGYLHLGEFDEKYAESGMAGILDLKLALEWVRDNIEQFGGDPSNVTIMGESGGASKICTLMAMPEAEGLFHKAIIESGASAAGTYTVEEATEAAQQFLDNLGVDPENLDALKDFTSEEIFTAAEGLSFSPVADGINLMPAESDEFVAYDCSADVPIMVGASEDEQGAFISTDVLDEITWDNLRDKLIEAGTCTEENVDNVIQVYKDTDTKDNTAEHLYLKIVSTSGSLGAGAHQMACAKAEQGTAPVYEYVVAYDSGLALDHSRKYAWHTADLPLQMRIVYYPESEELSKTMSSAWVAFARTGDPSTETLEWPEFNMDTQEVMIFDDECRVESDPWKVLRDAFNV